MHESSAMKIVLLRVPSIVDPTASTAPICLPIGLAYLKAALGNLTQNIIVLDSIGNLPTIRKIQVEGMPLMLLGQTAEELVSGISRGASIIFFSIMFSQDWLYSRIILREVRKKNPDALFIAGGEHITALPEFCMNAVPEIDMCVLGEGELIVQDVISKYQQCGRLPLDCPGTYVRIKDNEIRKNPRADRMAALDALPWPDWEGFPVENYLSGGHCFGVNLGRSMPILATRGCPYQCTFCSSSKMWTNAWRARNPEDVLEEMKVYVEKYKAKNFDFYDLTFIIKKDWILRFCELLIASNLNITWQLPSGTRSEVIDNQVARLLYRAGCRNLSFAPESGSDDVLKIIKKRISLSAMLTSMRACAKEGLNIKANIMCGFPEEKKKDLFKTLLFIVKAGWVGVDDLSINQFSPYPGSELFDFLVKRNKLELDEKYFEHLSSYASMSRAHSYSDNLSDRDILLFKYLGTMVFYTVSFVRRPRKLFTMVRNVCLGNETTRLEKTILSYKNRWFMGSQKTSIKADHR